MYDYETFGVFRFKDSQTDLVDKKSTLFAFSQALLLLIWIALYGVFIWKVDNQCAAPIDNYALMAFWVFIAAFIFKLLSIVLAMALIGSGKDRGALIIGISSMVIATVFIVFLWGTGIWALTFGVPGTGCRSLWYLTLAWVVLGTIDIVFLFVIPVSRLVGYLLGDKGDEKKKALAGDVEGAEIQKRN